MYLTFLEYQNMGGTLDETAFTNFEFEAESIIKYHTFNRFDNQTVYPDAVKRLTFKLIEVATKMAQSTSMGANADDKGTILKESNDGVSVEYSAINAADLYDLCKDVIPKHIKYYLSGVKNELGQLVLYKGVYPNE